MFFAFSLIISFFISLFPLDFPLRYAILILIRKEGIFTVQFNRYKNGALRALTMSFDDGRKQDEGLAEMFNRYDIKSTFHLIGSRYRDMSDEQLKAVADIYRGHEVSCHTINHPHMEHMPLSLCTKEIVEDRAILEKMCGYVVRGMSYPFGTYDSEVIYAMKAGGMLYSRTVNSTGWFYLPRDFMQWDPTTHFCSDLDEKWQRFSTITWINLPVFYIWGHSYELDSHENEWQIFEEFCKKISHAETVWFATNIEIYDYITALRGLQFSWDRRLVYNPSATDVWVEVDKEAVRIGGGETVDLGISASR